jgi:hypothetical protein
LFYSNLGKSGTNHEVNIFISNADDDISRSFGDRDGTLDAPFVDISNGVAKGLEETAAYSDPIINIYLFTGDHYALWNYEQYFPLSVDRNSNTQQINIR